MSVLQQIARSALLGDGLVTRGLLQDWLATHPRIEADPRPTDASLTEISLAASLAELLAERLGQPAPAWAGEIGPAPIPTYLLKSAATMRRLREMCQAESPLPLRRRGFYAPSNYLEFR